MQPSVHKEMENEQFGNQPSENDFDRKLKINEENNRMWSEIMNELSLKLYSRRHLWNIYYIHQFLWSVYYIL